MRLDRSLTVFIAVAGGIALGAALASGMRRNRQHRNVAQKQQHAIDLHEWEGEGGNLAPRPAPAVAAL